jgi:hypothetical protein
MDPEKQETKAAGSTESLTVSSQELGKLILGEANERYKESQQEKLFLEVQRMMGCRDESRRQVRHFTASADWFSRKLQALNDGAFKFDALTGALIFDDPDLQRANY